MLTSSDFDESVSLELGAGTGMVITGAISFLSNIMSLVI